MSNKKVRMIIDIFFNVIVVLLGIIIISTTGSKAYSFGRNIFDEEALTTEKYATEVQVTIHEGITEKQLATLLHDKGLVKDELICYLQIKLSDYKNKFVGGTYTLNTAMKPTQMMQVLCNISLDDED